MKLIDWILLVAVAALLIFAFRLATRRKGSCHDCGKGCCETKTEPKCSKCEHCDS